MKRPCKSDRLLCFVFLFSFTGITKDILLPRAPSTSNYTIHGSSNSYSGFLLVGPGNDLSIFLYDTSRGNNTSIIPLTPGMRQNVGGQTDFCFVGNRLIVTGSSPFDVDAFFPTVYEYELGDQTPLPTTASLVNSFITGTNDCIWVNALTLTNGTVAISYSLATTNSAVNLTYRFEDGTWTNYPTFQLLGTNLTPTLQTTAQMPGSGAFWVFINKDSSGWISAAEFMTGSNGTPGLFLNRRLFLATKQSGRMAPYGEMCSMTAISVKGTNCIALQYNNRDVIQAPSFYGWVTSGALVGFNNNLDRYLLGLTTKQVARLGTASMVSQIEDVFAVSFIETTTNNTTYTGSFPTFIDRRTLNGSLISTDSGPNSYYQTMFMSHPSSLDYVMRIPDGSWHLMIHPLQPTKPNPPTGVWITRL